MRVSNKMSATIEMSTVLETIKDLETRLSALRKLVEGGAKTKKPKKERDPDAPKREPNDWIKFTQRVDGLLKGADKSFKRVADSKKFAAHLKKAKVYAEWTDDAILAERETWTPPAVEEKDAASVGSAEVGTAEVPTEAKADAADAGAESGSESDSKKKPGRKPMTAEQKAAAKATREAKAAAMTPEEKEAAAAKKAEAAAKRKAKKEAAE